MEDRAQYEVIQKETTPATVLDLAIEKGASLEQLEKFMELKIRWEEREAKKAYVQAMANFKADPPEIEKIKHVKYPTSKGVAEYFCADLADVSKKVNKKLSEQGLSAAWETKQTDGLISVTCRITHAMGYSEETTLTASPDLSGSKNPIQAIGSSISYLERYTLLALTGLAAKDMDDDANSVGGEFNFLDEEQLSTITDFINAKSIDEAKFLAYMKAESLETIPADKYNVALAACRAAKGRQERGDA
jgi:hypothetical protein